MRYLILGILALAPAAHAGSLRVTLPTVEYTIDGEVYVETNGAAGAVVVFAPAEKAVSSTLASPGSRPPGYVAFGASVTVLDTANTVTFQDCTLTRVQAAEGGSTHVRLTCASQSGSF